MLYNQVSNKHIEVVMKKINLSQLKKKLSDNDFQAVVDAAYKNSFGDASLKNSTLRFESIVNNIEDKSIKSRVSSFNVDFAVFDI
jgi:hypothetical protein